MTLLYESENYLQKLIDQIPYIGIIAFISSYREIRGKLRDIFRANVIWTKWHNQQLINNVQSVYNDKPLIRSYKHHDPFYIKIRSVLIALICEPLPLLIQFGVWSIATLTGIFLDDPMQMEIVEGISFSRLLDNLISDYLNNILLILPLSIATAIQEVRGYKSGLAKKNQEYLEWYNKHLNEDNINESLELPTFVNKSQQLSNFSNSLSVYLFLQLGFGSLIYITTSSVLSVIGIVDNPNFFLRNFFMVLFIVI
ncbi:hypothetical protein JT359_18765 [Candidatus Poribacteria bacterium]|nr:hypothetical protein [Candidatus Poribacteria bacterium]